MEAVIRACQQPRLNLKSSPPFILEILPSMSQLLSQIFAKNPDALQTNEYLKIFINNLLQKCKEVSGFQIFLLYIPHSIVFRLTGYSETLIFLLKIAPPEVPWHCNPLYSHTCYRSLNLSFPMANLWVKNSELPKKMRQHFGPNILMIGL